MIARYPSWTPVDLSEWLEKFAHKFPSRTIVLYKRLATDQRMRDVWKWHETIREKIGRYQGRSAVGFAVRVEQAIRMPGKPGDMPPKRRSKYFENVRRHAEALIDLLSETRYDCAWDHSKEVDQEDNDVGNKIGEHILSAQSFVDSEPEGGDIRVAYSATAEGLYEMSWDYPDSHLTEILHEVCAWTQDDDYWGRGGLISSSTIRQTGPKARVIKFNCDLYTKFARIGIHIPFALLATTANVALDLPLERQVDEDAIRKQVRRCLSREVYPESPPQLDDADPPF